MWNHRDLNDHLQNEIEEIIRQMVPDYNYGSRREDPTAIINDSKLFGQVNYLEQNFKVEMPSSIFLEGWKSHATWHDKLVKNLHQCWSVFKRY